MSTKVYFADYGILRSVADYVVFISGIDYGEANKNISFSHESIDGGILFRSDIPLAQLSLKVLVIFDPRMIRF